MIRHLVLVIVALAAGPLGCSESEARNAASSLAATTGKLNDSIEIMNGSWNQIEIARNQIINDRSEAALETDDRVQSHLAIWRALEAKGNDYETRVLAFEAVQNEVAAEGARDESLTAINDKLIARIAQATGLKSTQLTQAVADLASLSKPATVINQVEFIAQFAQGVKDGVDSAAKDAKSAADNSTKLAANLNNSKAGNVPGASPTTRP